MTNQTEALAHLDRARMALEKARTTGEAFNIADRALFIQEQLKKAGATLTVLNEAGWLRLSALRKIGEMLNNGDRKQVGRPEKSSTLWKISPTWKEIGIPHTTGHQCIDLATLKGRVWLEIYERNRDARELTLALALRVARERGRKKLQRVDRRLVAKIHGGVLPEGMKVPTIVIDPPWDYRDIGYSERSLGIRPAYTQMRLPEIEAIPLDKFSMPDAHLYLWVTNPFLPAGLELVKKWGFRYLTLITWAKPEPKAGAYFQITTEHMIFAVRGSLSTKTQNRTNLLMAPRPGDHSTKPSEAYDLIEDCSPAPWLELFARKSRPHWYLWGNIQTTQEAQQ